MIECPMCRHHNADDARKCRRCQADLGLLVEYVSDLRVGLSKADKMTRDGELGEAVWAYLAVLEVDPDNATARRQVGKVATAVRQFDQTAPGRRWARAIRKRGRLRRWVSQWQDGEGGVWGWVVLFLLYFGSVCLAYYWGALSGREGRDEAPAASVSAR